MNLSKNLFQKNAFRTVSAAVLIAGLSMPLYAAETTESVDPAANAVSQTTKVVTTTTTTHAAKHKAHHAKSRTTKTTEVQQDAMSSDKVVWKNGIPYHDVEPTAQSQSSPFGVPTSTEDTLKGGITSTISPAPTQ